MTWNEKFLVVETKGTQVSEKHVLLKKDGEQWLREEQSPTPCGETLRSEIFPLI